MQGSLLDYLTAPVVVGDPDGNVIYVNASFKEVFQREGSVVGSPFVHLFDGGGREGVLQAIAGVCESGEPATFRLLEAGRGFRGSVSPIQADSDAVGVILLFTEEPSASRSLLDMLREMREPLDEVTNSLHELMEQAALQGDDGFRSGVERAMSALELAQKWGDAAYATLTDTARPGATADGTVDVARICRVVVGRLTSELDRLGLELEVLLPASLPQACGDPRHFETILARLLRDRAAHAAPLDSLGLCARADGSGSVLVSIIDPGSAETRRQEPDFERDSIAALAGYEHRRLRSAAGCVTTLRLPVRSDDD